MKNMKNVVLSISKSALLERVMMAAEYTGGKMMPGNAEAYDKIRIVDEDLQALQPFFAECCAEASRRLDRWLAAVNEHPLNTTDEGAPDQVYAAVLVITWRYKDVMQSSIEEHLLTYFVNALLAKWFLYTNKEEASGYAEMAEAAMEEVVSSLLRMYRPRRRTRPF